MAAKRTIFWVKSAMPLLSLLSMTFANDTSGGLEAIDEFQKVLPLQFVSCYFSYVTYLHLLNMS